MTVREALNAAEARLRKTGTPDARLDAEYMLAEALRAPRLSLLVDKQRPVPAPSIMPASNSSLGRPIMNWRSRKI